MSAQQKKADEVMGMVQDRQAREKSVEEMKCVSCGRADTPCPCNHKDPKHCRHCGAWLKDSEAVDNMVITEFMQGVDCPYCEENTPHTHAKLPSPLQDAPAYKTNALSSEDWTPISVPCRHDIKAGRLQDGKVQYLVRIEGMEDYVLDDLEPSAYVLAILEASYWQKRAWAAEARIAELLNEKGTTNV